MFLSARRATSYQLATWRTIGSTTGRLFQIGILEDSKQGRLALAAPFPTYPWK